MLPGVRRSPQTRRALSGNARMYLCLLSVGIVVIFGNTVLTLSTSVQMHAERHPAEPQELSRHSLRLHQLLMVGPGGDTEGRNASSGRAEAGTCRVAQQGPRLVADSTGRTCSPLEAEAGSECCPAEAVQYECATCVLGEEQQQQTHCCSEYAHCVACCLGPESRERLVHALLRVSDNPTLAKLDDAFDLCQFLCRTSSASTVHENAYNTDLRHCYTRTDKR
eukprot:TRINITY_DN2490_c0_g1_i4.p1 TRINITY_DN2490_c0_g1~~TRINITY_DN2490_c0_g1_i4.p1  ORF type:complete len:234 (+),score=35.87 TRINITY_DN2490_c0_g1_i4:37-702(+)